jgi:hypothetical protein
MSTRIAGPLAAVAVAATLIPAGLAGANSAGYLIGEIDATTAQRDTTFTYIFDATNFVVWNVGGTFSCAGDPSTSYRFATNGIKRPSRFAWGRRTSGSVKAALLKDDRPDGSVIVSWTATVRKTRGYTSKHRGKASGRGTFSLKGAPCDVDATTWRGSGTFEPN